MNRAYIKPMLIRTKQNIEGAQYYFYSSDKTWPKELF